MLLQSWTDRHFRFSSAFAPLCSTVQCICSSVLKILFGLQLKQMVLPSLDSHKEAELLGNARLKLRLSELQQEVRDPSCNSSGKPHRIPVMEAKLMDGAEREFVRVKIKRLG